MHNSLHTHTQPLILKKSTSLPPTPLMLDLGEEVAPWEVGRGGEVGWLRIRGDARGEP